MEYTLKFGDKLVLKNGEPILYDITSTQYMDASGGTVTTDGDYKIHTFSSPGSYDFIVSFGGDVSALVVGAGGGSVPPETGGSLIPVAGGGGGGGEVKESSIIIPTGNYIITVGDGRVGMQGETSSISNLISAIGGWPSSTAAGGDSGSGKIGGTSSWSFGPSVSGGGGAGDSENGYNAPSSSVGGDGGNGTLSTITGLYYGGGGGGGGFTQIPGEQSSGGTSGLGEIGRGGSGRTTGDTGLPGAAGIVIIKYKYK